MREKRVTVTCSVCGHSETHVARKNAAPMITLLTDTLRPKGWSYTVDFLSMMTGDYRPVCPDCQQGAGAEKR